MSLFSVVTPSERFDRLVFERIVHAGIDGFTWFCHVCKEHQPTEPVTADIQHSWFDTMVREMCDHVAEDVRSEQ